MVVQYEDGVCSFRPEVFPLRDTAFEILASIVAIQLLTSGKKKKHDKTLKTCILGAIFCGSGIGFAFTANGSTGGTDIIAAIVNKYRDVSLGRMILFCDMIIFASCYFVLDDLEKVVYGYVTLFVTGYMIDQVVNSSRQAVQFFIISSKYEEIGREINALHRGVTVIDGTGLYTGKQVKMMFVLAKKSQSNTIFQIINDIDPRAFVSQSAVIGVYGEGFDHFKVKKKTN